MVLLSIVAPVVFKIAHAEFAMTQLPSDQGPALVTFEVMHPVSCAYPKGGEREAISWVEILGREFPLPAAEESSRITSGQHIHAADLGRDLLDEHLFGLDFLTWKIYLWPTSERKDAQKWLAGKDGTVTLPLGTNEEGIPTVRLEVDGKETVAQLATSFGFSCLGSPTFSSRSHRVGRSHVTQAWRIKLGDHSFPVAGVARPWPSPQIIRAQDFCAERVLIDLAAGELRLPKASPNDVLARIFHLYLQTPAVVKEGKVYALDHDGTNPEEPASVAGVSWKEIVEDLSGTNAAKRLLWLGQQRREDIKLGFHRSDGTVYEVKLSKGHP